MNFLARTTLGFASAALLAGAANAGTMDGDKVKVDKNKPETVVATTTRTVQTLDADGQVGQLTLVEIDRDAETTAVLGALAMQTTDAYIVKDNDGDLFINHLVPVEELPDPTLMVDAVETYEITHRGMTFTNKVVVEPR
ncbi:hypothetical protein [uncultured Algimonas sp.]|uniref:hypothetical protein n=1 Tax=uncultured Algimonas sp. TaxID=1547920 RepID=UPI0026152D0C|nr:hypothetical protein [uncultured Algimonas sp.]